ncbi:MAG: endonuclease/exonuclease/phosphatase family protein [Flavobacterium sp.]|uniref:endonuclease/exonuclease/phosphatase family protein n=1 Tax=Flavobacterium sp. TaxID=239 RepID=UPI0012040976|nr:endonuclease/exonuclease/phosphatase family protein [Flavobacterium sp.]RZJ65573.1 MAG: endonuclease/exonuclease/phosphatase family protein [Flavobacterium sp.]
MKIATWNLERPKSNSSRISKIVEILKSIDADIIILTETNRSIYIGEEYNYSHSAELPEDFYLSGERRTSILSKYRIVRSFQTRDDKTSLSIEFETPLGNLIVYATIVGIFGNRRDDFLVDQQQQLEDLTTLFEVNLPIIYAGDLNISFCDNYYFTKSGRENFCRTFQNLDLEITTENIPENIDHIVISKSILKDRKTNETVWNLDKKLSDHIGIAIEII